MSDRIDLREFVGGFVVESEELVGLAGAALLDIEAGNTEGSTRPRSVRELFRALHTLKGLAGMIGVEPIVEVSHALETVVRTADRGAGRLGRAAVDLCLQGLREIAERVRAVAEARAVAAIPESLMDAIATLEHASEAATPPVAIAAEWDGRLSQAERQQVVSGVRAGRAVWSLDFAPSDERAARDLTIGTVRARLTALGEIVKVAPRAHPGSADAPAGLVFELLFVSDAAPAAIALAVESAVERLRRIVVEVPAAHEVVPELDLVPDAVGRSVIRVELARLDDLQEQLSLLLVSRFRLDRAIAAAAARGGDVRELGAVSELQGQLLRGLRRAILRARMVRVAEVLEPLPLLVRSVARGSGKEVALVIDARDTELDKAVADRLLPAIIHLVRNAVDHAIEPADERDRLGKPRAGTIHVTCRDHAGNQLELAIRDDGRGIDRAAVARRAGRPVDDDGALLEVLATPGFSTRDVADARSGRGLGMDIVRTVTVGELGGELSVTSAAGAGTTFTLRVPLTIAVVDVFSFECCGQAFAVPVAAVDEIFELADDVAFAVPDPSTRAVPVALCRRRGRAMPVVALGALLALDGPGPSKALVIRRNGEPFAFAVHRMIGRHEVVVRPIEDPLAHALGIAGATDLGDGRPTLVLDLAELVDRVHTRPEARS